MKSIKVVGHKWLVRNAVYLASILPRGTPVAWRDGQETGTGTLELTWSCCDEFVAQVKVADGLIRSILLWNGNRIRRLKDTRRLVGMGIDGSGI